MAAKLLAMALGPLDGDARAPVAGLRRLHALPAAGHQTDVRLFLDRAYGIITFAFGNGRGPLANFAGPAIRPCTARTKIGDLQESVRIAPGQGHPEDRRYLRVAADPSGARLGLVLGVVAIAGMLPTGVFMSESWSPTDYRNGRRFGGAAGSITAAKQQRVILAARYWLAGAGRRHAAPALPLRRGAARQPEAAPPRVDPRPLMRLARIRARRYPGRPPRHCPLTPSTSASWRAALAPAGFQYHGAAIHWMPWWKATR